jgi:hypothetical protein
MRLYAQRRLIAGTALLAFLFAVAFPALAVARQAVDPLAYAGICRIDTGADPVAGAPGSLPGKLKSAHCVLCVGTASLPPVIVVAAVVVAAVPELLLPMDRGLQVMRDTGAFQPLHPRAPPRA